jgi:hypothetical protein
VASHEHNLLPFGTPQSYPLLSAQSKAFIAANNKERMGECMILCVAVPFFVVDIRSRSATGLTRSKQDQRRGYQLWATSSCTKIISLVASFVLPIHLSNSNFCDSRCPFGQIDNRKQMLGGLRSSFQKMSQTFGCRGSGPTVRIGRVLHISLSRAQHAHGGGFAGSEV